MHQNDQCLSYEKNKDEVRGMFKSFHKNAKSMYNANIRALHSNNGGEHTLKECEPIYMTK